MTKEDKETPALVNAIVNRRLQALRREYETQAYRALQRAERLADAYRTGKHRAEVLQRELAQAKSQMNDILDALVHECETEDNG